MPVVPQLPQPWNDNFSSHTRVSFHYLTSEVREIPILKVEKDSNKASCLSEI